MPLIFQSNLWIRKLKIVSKASNFKFSDQRLVEKLEARSSYYLMYSTVLNPLCGFYRAPLVLLLISSALVVILPSITTN